MALIVLTKINAKLKFLYRQTRYLTPAYRRLLCNALIQPNFDYGYCSWFPLLKKNLKLKLQKAKNMYLLLPKFNSKVSYDPSHFRIINWLPVSNRVEYCIVNTVFKYWNGIVPGYIHEMFKPPLCRYSTRSQMALDITSAENKYRAKKLILHRAKNMVQNGP